MHVSVSVSTQVTRNMRPKPSKRPGSFGDSPTQLVTVPMSASATVTGARHGQGHGRQRREPSVDFCAIWASRAALVMHSEAYCPASHTPALADLITSCPRPGTLAPARLLGLLRPW